MENFFVRKGDFYENPADSGGICGNYNGFLILEVHVVEGIAEVFGLSLLSIGLEFVTKFFS